MNAARADDGVGVLYFGRHRAKKARQRQSAKGPILHGRSPLWMIWQIAPPVRD
jgi:hypothetical protein